MVLETLDPQIINRANNADTGAGAGILLERAFGSSPKSDKVDIMAASNRLILRRWRAADIAPFAAMNADPLTMRFMPGVLSTAETEALVERFEAHHDAHGFGVWAVEVPGVAPFVGYTGLQRVSFEAPFAPAVEVGWRLAPAFWGRGYATEAAREALRFGFEDLNLDQIVSFTVAANKPSWAVMERLGMARDARGDFDHPRLPSGHALRRHILYRMTRASWRGGEATSFRLR